MAFYQPPVQWMAVVFSSEIRRSGSEGDHFSSPSAEIEHEWSYTSTPLSVMNLSY
jgi:hypothetical protein